MTSREPVATRRPRPRWSWQLGSIAGIPIRVHVTLFLLLAWIAVAYWLGGLGPSATALGVAIVAIVFAIIVIHELGHALMARRFGIDTRDILLLPIGGIASLERIPERPAHELLIALVGPLINVAIAALLWLGIALAGGDLSLDAASPGMGLAVRLFWINVVLAGFNLLPAFPLDGGRVLRAVLSLWMSREAATSIAASLGKLLAIVFAVIGVFFNPWLVLIALVVWMGARHEDALVHLRAALAGVPASAAMLRHLDIVDADDSLESAATRMVGSGSPALPVLDHGRTVGVLTTADVATGIETEGPDAPVARAPRHEAIPLAPTEPLDHVLDRLQEAPEAIGVVIDRDVPVGIVTPDQLASYAALHGRT